MSSNLLVLTGHSIGGGEKRLGRLALYLAEQGEYTIVTNATLVKALDKQGINLSKIENKVVFFDVYWLVKRFSLLAPIQSLLLLLQLRWLFAKKRYNLVHFFGFHHGVFAKCVSKIKANRIGYSVVSTRMISEPRESGLYDRLSIVAKYADYFDCLSTDIKDSVCSSFMLPEQVVFDAPCSFIDFKPLNLPEIKKGVVFISRF